ncbi:MAG: DUF4381 domain-containing protein [Candidatus Binatia bacterium]
MNAPQDLPLRDIHLPAPVPWWPPAPGWWVLLGILVSALAAAWGLRAWRRRTALRRAARRRLAEIAAGYATHADPGRLTAELSLLCRQVALHVDGEAAAAVTGDPWLARLDACGGGEFFRSGAGRVLADAPYARSAHGVDARALLDGLANWLNRLPTRESPHV